MAKQSKKRRFSNNQVVVCRFSDRYFVGKVVFIRPVGKNFIYDVLSEDSRVYTEMGVDSGMNYCIDTRMTKLFYKKYNIDENSIPDFDSGIGPILNINLPEAAAEETEVAVEVDTEDEAMRSLEDEDNDPNW